MKLAIISLDRIELLEDLLSALVEVGVTDAHVADVSALGYILSEKTPIFAGLMNVFAGTSPIRKLIVFQVENEWKNRIIELTKDICIDEDEESTGSIIFIPVDESIPIN